MPSRRGSTPDYAPRFFCAFCAFSPLLGILFLPAVGGVCLPETDIPLELLKFGLVIIIGVHVTAGSQFLEFGRWSFERVVIATNAWAAKLPELKRQFVCVGSSVLSTPAIPERLAAIGWTGGESISDSQATVTYYRTTRAGRIVFGKGGGRLYYTGAPGPQVFQDSSGIAEATADFRRVYPMLSDVPIGRCWTGPIDRTYDSLPLLGHLAGAPHVVYGIGCQAARTGERTVRLRKFHARKPGNARRPGGDAPAHDNGPRKPGLAPLRCTRRVA